MKLKGAITNTHGDAVPGVIINKEHFKYAAVFVRCTSDEMGETMSLQFEDLMIAVPYAAVEKIMKETRDENPHRAL